MYYIEIKLMNSYEDLKIRINIELKEKYVLYLYILLQRICRITVSSVFKYRGKINNLKTSLHWKKMETMNYNL